MATPSTGQPQRGNGNNNSGDEEKHKAFIEDLEAILPTRHFDSFARVVRNLDRARKFHPESRPINRRRLARVIAEYPLPNPLDYARSGNRAGNYECASRAAMDGCSIAICRPGADRR